VLFGCRFVVCLGDFDLDVRLPWTAACGGPFHAVTDKADVRRRIDGSSIASGVATSTDRAGAAGDRRSPVHLLSQEEPATCSFQTARRPQRRRVLVLY
jgi:hypothetical protein